MATATAKKTATPAAPAPAPASNGVALPSFSEASVPTETREKKDNPYAPVVADLAANRSKALEFTLSDSEKTKHFGLIRRAGQAAGVTVRVKEGKGANGSTPVTIWVVDKISRPRTAK